MEFIRTLLEQQPLMALFLTIAIGYLVGEINIKGFSLGVGAVLFVALAMGWFAPKSAPAPMVGTLGLALFLYARGRAVRQAVLPRPDERRRAAGRTCMALIGVLLAGAVSILFVKAMDLNLGYALGLFAGSGTSTPTLQAAIATLGNDDPAVGYSVSYPFGVAGPILFLYIVFMMLKPKIEAPSAAGLELLEIALRNPGSLRQDARRGDGGAAGRRADRGAAHGRSRNEPASPNIVVAENDVVLAVGPSKEALAQASQEPRRGGARPHRSRIAATSTTCACSPPARRWWAARSAISTCRATRRRSSSRCAAATPTSCRAPISCSSSATASACSPIAAISRRMRKFFGDSIKGTAEFSYISIGLGMALGFLIGAIQIPLPGIGKIALGLSGVLIVALILGNLRRTGGMNWTIPLSANLVLRNLGLTLFLAQVGMASGPKFAATVAETGFLMLGLGAIVLVALVLPILVLGLFVFRMPYDEVAGIVAGACGNPAILAYANKLAPTDRPDIGYAMIFPGMTIVKILFVDIVPALIR